MPIAPRDMQAPQETPGTDTGTTVENRRGRRVHTDMVAAAVIIALSALVWGGTLTFEEVPAALTQGMSAGAFPRLVLGVLIVLAVWLALTCRGRADPEREPIHRMVFLTAGAGLAFMVALKVFGIYGAILFSFFGIGRLWGERRWFLLAAIAIGITITVHVIFVRAFGIPLPVGMSGQWLT